MSSALCVGVSCDETITITLCVLRVLCGEKKGI